MMAILAEPVVRTVLDALPGARLVGGCVRDTIAGRPVMDIDLATPDPPDTVMAHAARAGLKVVPTGLQHGTVTVMSAGQPFEVTTLRRDRETDGRHAAVEWTGDWREDAARRDFTINAMSLSRDGALHDYFGGRADLAAGRVRFVGDPAQRIAEDYLRILRFFRFQARYGAGPADPAALAAIRDGIPGLARLSPERVWSELKRILVIPDPDPALDEMRAAGVLPAILPDSRDVAVAALPPVPELRLAAVSAAPAAVLADRLRLSVKERDALDRLRHAPVLTAAADAAELRRARADWLAEALTGAAWLAGHDGAALAARLPAEMRFPLEGRDVVAAGVPPGPAVGAMLRRVRAWWMARGAQDDARSCRAELARQVAEHPPG